MNFDRYSDFGNVIREKNVGVNFGKGVRYGDMEDFLIKATVGNSNAFTTDNDRNLNILLVGIEDSSSELGNHLRDWTD